MPLSDFIKILRPVNCVMAALGTFIGYSIASSLLECQPGILLECQPGIGLAMLVAFLVCGGGMVINDYFDLEIDRKQHPEKALVSGRIKPKAALLYSALLFLAGIVLAFLYLPTTAFIIALAFTILLVAYSRFLGKAKYLGNWVVASGTAFTLVFGASLVGNYTVVAWLAIAALFANLARELIKDVEDLKVDKGFKQSLPMVLGKKKTLWFAFLYYLIAIIAVYLPVFLHGFNSPAFIALVSIANLVFVASFRKARKRSYASAQKLSKIGMVVALIGFLAGVV
jgi:4-hydroxybenzoate polyprenyltransferase